MTTIEPRLNIPLATAAAMADTIVSELIDYCTYIQVAGSIRRQCPLVNDIDIVLMPKPGMRATVRDRALRTQPHVLVNGKSNLELLLHNRIRLDLWIAQDGQRTLWGQGGHNYGSLLLCRTGSRNHNIQLIDHAQRQGLRWNPYWGVYDALGACIASETEESIFAALNLPYITPEDRP